MTPWQTAYAQAITDPQQLLSLLELDAHWLPAARQAAALFSLRVPLSFVAKMRKGDPTDPLLRQVLPLAEELLQHPAYLNDPLQEHHANPHPGLLHKYRGRALLITTGACAIHCRYCFRRHFDYSSQAEPDWSQLAAYFLEQELDEIILSGGDPLSLSNQRLQRIWQQLHAIPSLRRIRLHTRLPVVLPERIDPGLLELLAASPWPVVLVIHSNHPHELGADVQQALAALRHLPYLTLLNQTVLLKGVNDHAATLAALSHALFEAGVLPYYLHLLDSVQGAQHFAIPDAAAKQLFQQLQQQLPGYLVPRLVREIPAAKSKTLVL